MTSPAEDASEATLKNGSYPPGAKKEVNILFEKKFKFKKSDNWKVPPAQLLFSEAYSIESLQELKEKLNAVKSKLNDYPIEHWSAHTRRRNPSGDIAWRLKSGIEAEFVTQAWCKFYECLNQYPIVSGPKLNSLHLCEAPGAFIAALNHFLHSNYPTVEWKWLASTLNPYYEGNPLANMVIDDRFMLHTLENWAFGKDFTGNIMNKENVEDMARQAAEIGELHLVTADGSIDCMETPECQEEVVSSLHYAEACAALRMLSAGGSFVLKMFTLFEATSASLLYLLNCLFEKVNVFKPATSKCGNSEVYVVCIGFKKDDPSFASTYSAMLEQLENAKHNPLFPARCLPDTFMHQLESCARVFMYHQIRVIEANIASFGNSSRLEDKRCKALRNHVANYYFNRFNVQTIRNTDKILYSRNVAVQYCTRSRIYTGSFTERMSMHCKSVEERLATLRNDLEDFEMSLSWPYNSDLVTIVQSECNHEIHRYYGKPMTQVVSSLFIEIHLMHLINKIFKVVPGAVSFSITISMDSNELPFKHLELSLRNDFNRQERALLRNIIDWMVEFKPSTTVIRGLPLLTHFTVSVISLLLNVFEEISFSDKRTVVFDRIKLDGGEDWLLRIQALFKETDDVSNVLCLVNIKKLHGNALSEAITNYNNQICMQYCRTLIDSH